MRHSRAYLAGFGVMGVMIGLALILLLVGTGLLIYKNWPPAPGPQRSPEVQVRAQPAKPETRGERRRSRSRRSVVRVPAAPRRSRPTVVRAATPSPDPLPPAPPSPPPAPDPACSDGRDNDGDGDTDFGDDAGCRSARDDNEIDAKALPAQAPPSTPSVPPPGPGPSLRGTAAQVTENLTGALGNTVAPLNEPLGQQLTTTGKDLGAVVRSLPLP